MTRCGASNNEVWFVNVTIDRYDCRSAIEHAGGLLADFTKRLAIHSTIALENAQ